MKKKKLEIQVCYEPNRFAKRYLSEVYQKFIPKTKRTIDFAEKKDLRNETIEPTRILKC